MDALEAIASRRSIRSFDPRPVPEELVRSLIEAACAAPAPHHAWPWRFVRVGPDTRLRLSEAMAEAWREDAAPSPELDAAIGRSARELTDAPVLLLSCIEMSGAPTWPDDRRRSAERDMFVQSLGAALQNLLLAAHARGLTGYLKGAPLFCADAVSEALELPEGWQPAFLALLGYPDPSSSPPPRPPFDPDTSVVSR